MQQSWYLLLSQVCIISQCPLPILVMGDVWVPYVNLEIHVQRLLSAHKQQPWQVRQQWQAVGIQAGAEGVGTVTSALESTLQLISRRIFW